MCIRDRDEVGEFDRIANEEDRQVVADEVPVAIFGAELDRETTRVTGDFRRITATGDGGKADAERRLLALLLKELRAGVRAGGIVTDGAVCLELTMGDSATRVHDALRHALAVEVADLFEVLVVFERARPAVADRAHVLVVVDRVSLTGGQDRFLARSPAVRLAIAAVTHCRSPRRVWLVRDQTTNAT